MTDRRSDWHYIGDGRWETSMGQVIMFVHDPEACAGKPCAIHNPSDHHMREWPTHWRYARGITERICPHGVGHPDPDEMAYQRTLGDKGDQGVHGCCGERCCSG